LAQLQPQLLGLLRQLLILLMHEEEVLLALLKLPFHFLY
jgi:hypothetical protein